MKERVPSILTHMGSRSAMELLFDSSVIGVRLANAGVARFKCEDSDLVLPATGGVYVHQSLYKGLNLRERRGGEAVGEEMSEGGDSASAPN